MAEEVIDEARALELIRWLENFLGADWIDDQLSLRAKQSAAFEPWSPPHIHENPLINTIAAYRQLTANSDTTTALHSVPGKRTVEHASDVHRVVPHLQTKKVDALKSLLRRSTAPGFLYQCKIAAHYIRDGCRLVSYSIGEEQAGDVIVGNVDGEVELQCKAIDLGAGRRINNRVFDDLAVRLLNEADSRRWVGIVCFECIGRLRAEDVPRLVKDVVARMDGQKAKSTVGPDYSIEVKELGGNVSPQEVDAALVGDEGRPLCRPHVAVLGNRHESGVRVLVTATSQKNDKIVGKMLATANSAAKQLDGLRPGVVCVHTPEPISWQKVAEAGVLDRHVNAGFRHFGSSDVAALVFTSEDETGNAYAFRNPQTRMSLPQGFRIVGELPAAK